MYSTHFAYTVKMLFFVIMGLCLWGNGDADGTAGFNQGCLAIKEIRQPTSQEISPTSYERSYPVIVLKTHCHSLP